MGRGSPVFPGKWLWLAAAGLLLALCPPVLAGAPAGGPAETPSPWTPAPAGSGEFILCPNTDACPILSAKGKEFVFTPLGVLSRPAGGEWEIVPAFYRRPLRAIGALGGLAWVEEYGDERRLLALDPADWSAARELALPERSRVLAVDDEGYWLLQEESIALIPHSVRIHESIARYDLEGRERHHFRPRSSRPRGETPTAGDVPVGVIMWSEADADAALARVVFPGYARDIEEGAGNEERFVRIDARTGDWRVVETPPGDQGAGFPPDWARRGEYPLGILATMADRLLALVDTPAGHIFLEVRDDGTQRVRFIAPVADPASVRAAVAGDAFCLLYGNHLIRLDPEDDVISTGALRDPPPVAAGPATLLGASADYFLVGRGLGIVYEAYRPDFSFAGSFSLPTLGLTPHRGLAGDTACVSSGNLQEFRRCQLPTGEELATRSWADHFARWREAQAELAGQPQARAGSGPRSFRPLPDGRIFMVFGLYLRPNSPREDRLAAFVYDPRADEWQGELLPEGVVPRSLFPYIARDTNTGRQFVFRDDRWQALERNLEFFERDETPGLLTPYEFYWQAITRRFAYARTDFGLFRVELPPVVD